MNYGEFLIAFLGYLHSPKWSKLNISYRKSSNNILLRRKSKNITNLTNLTFKRFNSSLVKHLNKECYHLTDKNLNPVYIYENLELDSTQKKIKSETLNLSGIYLILNKITIDYYIGSASTNRFFARFSNHLVNFHGSKIVKAAVRN